MKKLAPMLFLKLVGAALRRSWHKSVSLSVLYFTLQKLCTRSGVTVLDPEKLFYL